MFVNIGDVDDQFYRYKRPVVQCEFKNGKTKILNLTEIATALHTNELYILHYIQLSKSVAIIKNEIVSKINATELEILINEFINKYILCNKCNYPELITKISNKKLYSTCNACGNHQLIPENKFTKIIYKMHVA